MNLAETSLHLPPNLAFADGQGKTDHSEMRRFVKEVFSLHYGADMEPYCKSFLGVRDLSGNLSAVAGCTFAEDGALFLERYLDGPVEQYVSDWVGSSVNRSQIVEVGNLAALQAGGARMLIKLLTRHLHALGREYVAFTATSHLLNSFRRLGLNPVAIAPASPERIKNASQWGDYYKLKPVVAIGSIRQGFESMSGLESLQVKECLQ